MTGQELRQILLDKWGYSYDVQFRRAQGKIFLQVMWKYLEQASFPLNEAEYQEHLDSIANYLHALGGSTQVETFITQTRESPPAWQSCQHSSRFGRTFFGMDIVTAYCINVNKFLNNYTIFYSKIPSEKY